MPTTSWQRCRRPSRIRFRRPPRPLRPRRRTRQVFQRTDTRMSLLMTFRIAFKALSRNKMRTALTMLGMIIGVSAVITLVAMGNGATAMIEDQIKGAGTNLITVNAGNASQGGVRGGAGTSSALTPEDAEAIRREVPGVQYLAAGIGMQAQVVAGNQNWYTRIQGTDVDL